MAKKPEALRGGMSSFNADGSPCLAVWKAVCQIKESSDKVVQQLENKTRARTALERELDEMEDDDDDFRDKTAELYRLNRDIKSLRADRDAYIARYGQVVDLANANKIDPSASAKQIIKQAEEEAEDSEEEDEDPDQGKLRPSKPCSPSSLWVDQHKALPDAFGGREWGAVKTHAEKLPDEANSPLKMARWLARRFGELTETKSRRELLPSTPPWFKDSVLAVLAKQGAGEVSKGVAQDEQHAADMLISFRRCAKVDVDAWIDLTGGKDSALNKLVLAADKAAS